MWLEPIDFSVDIAWDSTISNSSGVSSNTAEVRQLINKAYTTPLNINQQKQLENALDIEPGLILHVELTPVKVSLTIYPILIFISIKLIFKQKFGSLVESNPLIAVKMIMCFQDSSDLSP